MLEEEKMSFGKLLKFARKNANLTQEQLGKSVGYSVGQISMLESGERVPNLKVVRTGFIKALQLHENSELAKHLLALAEQNSNDQPAMAVRPLPVQPEPGNLPHALNPIEGRTSELALLQQQLKVKKTRLITLVGAPGVGKTRLALETAHANIDLFPDGAWWIELAAVVHPDDFVSALVQSLGLSLPGAEASLVQLKRALLQRRCLLVLDNFEHILPAATQLAELLKVCGGITVLVTSRQALNIQGEHLHPLDGLAFPLDIDQWQLNPSRRLPAIRLFVDRVQALYPNFQLTPDNARDIAIICAQLDGLPLAIELAAAQLASVSLRDIAEQLSQPSLPNQFTLASPAIDTPERHKTLNRAIEWSYALINHSTRQLFCELGIFAGGASATAIQSICSPPTQTGLGTLISQNLLKAASVQGQSTQRFDMLEVVRQYARIKLEEEGLLSALRQRHAEFFAGLVDDAHKVAGYAVSGEINQQIRREQANIREALSWCVAHQPVTGLKIAASYWKFWEAWGQLSTGCSILEQLLSICPESTPYRARALVGLAWLRRDLAQHLEAVPLFEQAIARFTTDKSNAELADAQIRMADNLRALGHYPEAERLLHDALTLCRQANALEIQAAALHNLLTLQANLGQYQLAEHTLNKYLVLARQINHTGHIGWALAHLAEIARFKGESKDMHDLAEESMHIFEDQQDVHGMMYVCLLEAPLDAQTGNFTHAKNRLKRSLKMCRDYGISPTRIGRALCYLGLVAIQDGQVTNGVRLLAASERVDPHWARKSIPADTIWRNNVIQFAVQALTETGFQQAQFEGRSLSLDTMFNIALSEIL